MKKIWLVLLTNLFLLFSINCYAEGPGWLAWSKVDQLVVTSSGGVNISLEQQLTNCVSQAGYGPAYASIYPDHPGIDRMYSALLAAAMSGKRIRLYLENSECKVVEFRLEINP